MSKKEISQDDYDRFRKEYQDASPEKRRRIVELFVAEMYDELYAAAQRWRGAEVETSSIAIETYERLTKYLDRDQKRLESYPDLKTFSRLIRRVAFHASIEKRRFYQPKAGDEKRITPFSQYDVEDESSISDLAIQNDDFIQAIATNDVLEKFWEFIDDRFDARQANLLRLYFVDGMSYEEISEAFKGERSPDAIRAAIRRLCDRIVAIGDKRFNPNSDDES